MKHSTIGSYKWISFIQLLGSINKLRIILDIDVLCCKGYSKFLLESLTFKDMLFKLGIENNLIKRSISKLLGISER